MSSFAWLDFSEADRRAALDLIEQFRETDTRDELGLGSVRDTFSDLLFPGTSAVQTRARYFLIVPWLYMRLEARKTSSADAEKKARDDETKLISVLLDSDDATGTLGSRAGTTLKRLPSEIYWQGLGRLGIRQFPGGRTSYHRSFDKFAARQTRQVKTDDGEDIGFADRQNWDVGLPAPPPGFTKACSLALTRSEAEYLLERVKSCAGDSVMAYLLDQDVAPPDVPFVWQHPALAIFPKALRETLSHAQAFSEFMHGANLLYNYMLAEMRGDDALLLAYADRLTTWQQLPLISGAEAASWNRRNFWQAVRMAGGLVPPRTSTFVDRWIDLVQSSAGQSIAQLPAARALVATRERELKGAHSRLDNAEALRMWSGAAGAGQLDYRWGSIARQIVADIHEGMQQHDA